MRFLAAGAALLLTGCAANAADQAELGGPPLSPTVEIGRSLAQQRCASCHAVDASLDSPRAGAPPFVVLKDRYLPTSLQRRLEAMNETEHSEMPPLRIHWDEVEALGAYMQSLPSR